MWYSYYEIIIYRRIVISSTLFYDTTIKKDTIMGKNELFGLCPYVTSQKVLTGKWSLYIMHLLSQQPSVRFNELKREMPEEMTHTTLSRQLKTLEKEGLISRREYSQIPPRVEYSLSDIGKKFKVVLDALGEWGKEYIEYMNNRDSGLSGEFKA